MGLDWQLLAALDFSTLPQQLVNGILLGAIYSLVALGYTMVYGVLRLINFAHGEVFMLGAYTALLTSWTLGFRTLAPDQQSNIFTLALLLLASMAVCGIVGVLIEFFAYRPMRNQPRIAALITAIGVSMLLQYGGALVLPVSPPPSINERVNPLRGTLSWTLAPPDRQLQARHQEALQAFETARVRYEAATTSPPDTAAELRTEMQDREREAGMLGRQVDNSAVRILIPKGQLVMLITTVFLMALLTYLVLFTRVGRGMRALSHDFSTAGLMGINVNRIVTFTFLIGSVLAGAGAMMHSTFIGTPLTTFYGLQFGVKAFVAAVLGGIGNIPGAVLGGLLMGVAETAVVWAGYSSYRDAVAFVILIIILLFRPGGLLGSSKVEKV